MKLYRCVYQMGVETALEYRANMVLTLLSTIFPIIIQTFCGIICTATGMRER